MNPLSLAIWRMNPPLPKPVKRYLKRKFNPIIRILQEDMQDTKNVLDVGCGSCSPIRYIEHNQYRVGIDIWEKSIQKSKERKLHDFYIIGDVLALTQTFKPKHFDLVICFDVLEHLPKEKGFKLIEAMQRAGKKVSIIVPLGEFEQGEEGGNPYQKHKSAWQPTDFEKLGFNTKIFQTKRCKQIHAITRNTIPL